MTYFCCEERRRSAVEGQTAVNGIDYLEVVDREASTEELRQRQLRVHFVNPPDAALLARFPAPGFAGVALVRITGGERTRGIVVESAVFDGDVLVVQVNPRGDFSTYTLSLADPDTHLPWAELDPILASVDFSFKVECPSDFDCKPACLCPPEAASAPELDYLAKDYASFRQLLLDRLAILAPGWTERNPADLGITLVELLAYVGDYLSYRQDAVATEAYLGTARKRRSVRRHTRLLDYTMHDGCNARAWVQVRLNEGVGVPVDLPANGVRFVTRLDAGTVLDEVEFQRLAAQFGPEVFEPMHAATLFVEHNELKFHTWGNTVCCLPQGATKATLRGALTNLAKDDVLVFIERIGPATGDAADANPQRRHAVRLTRVGFRTDPLEASGGADLAVTDIEWATADALPFPLCLSSIADEDGRHLSDVSVALGNIVLADHGMRLAEREPLGAVPAPNPALAPLASTRCGLCGGTESRTVAARYRPPLKNTPLTQVAAVRTVSVRGGRTQRLPFDPAGPASDALKFDPREALPAIDLIDSQGRPWSPQRDLLSSDAAAPEFVAEVDNDSSVILRFGDDENGMRPGEGVSFEADYRVGNGARGNVGADTIRHLVIVSPLVAGDVVASITNPLAARGGVDAEPLERARQHAPAAYRINLRAVTPEDYAAKAAEHPEIQHAAATLRWTGSWHTVFLTVDRRGGRPVDAAFELDLRAHLERYRLAGHDLEIDGPRFVALELELIVCVAPDYFASDVVAALQDVFTRGIRRDGSRGFFHPDEFTFGEPVALSRIYAAAQRVAGVKHVEVTLLQRLGSTQPGVPSSGALDIGRLEIAQLDNDPNFRDRGVLRIQPVGGR